MIHLEYCRVLDDSHGNIFIEAKLTRPEDKYMPSAQELLDEADYEKEIEDGLC